MTAARQSSQVEPRAAVIYDAFMSYSHAADGLLAPRLQAGLQRFAKPWWRRRALRIFRDEASLSANPHLWSSITEALDESGWFVVLLSPDAAASPWVNREVEYWLADRDPSRIIPVLTEGDLLWKDGEIVSDAAPPALRRAFSQEPRWVDLRFARSDEQLDLKNPQFSAAVADIASAVRGVPKDELASEEVRQHRRTVRTAWAAAASLFALAVFATGAAFLALDRQAEAESQTARAEQEAARAEDERLRAEEQAEIARTNEELARVSESQALDLAAVVEARRLIATSSNVLSEDPELSLLLGLVATEGIPAHATAVKAEAAIALTEALEQHRLLKRFTASPEGNVGVISPDGTTIYHAPENGLTLTATDVATGDTLWARTLESDTGIWDVEVSPSGTQVALRLGLFVFAESGELSTPSRLVILDSGNGDPVLDIQPGDCPLVNSWHEEFSPDGRLFSVYTGTSGCRNDGSADWVAIYDTESWSEMTRIAASPGRPPLAQDVQAFAASDGLDEVAFSAANRILISGFYAESAVRSFPDLGLVRRIGPTWLMAISPDGSRFVYVPVNNRHTRTSDPVLADTSSQLAVLTLDEGSPNALDNPVSFSPDGKKIAVSTDTYDYVFLTEADDTFGGTVYGSRLFRMADDGDGNQHSWTADSSRLLTMSHDPSLLLWDVDLVPSVHLQGLMGLDYKGLVALARERITRGFTKGECTIHAVDPCPTLEEIRRG